MLRQTLCKTAPKILANPIASARRTITDLPKLDYELNALEPFISGEINEIHYAKHHQTYVNNYNKFEQELRQAIEAKDVVAQNQLTPLLKFNSGGAINHAIWWKCLAPQKEGGGVPPETDSPLGKAIASQYGNVDKLTEVVNGKLAGIQGSGWAWIVKNNFTGQLEVITTANQDTVPTGFTPLVGIDAWEHAYYLQYKNVKVDYFKQVWNVVNWNYAAEKFGY